MFKNKISQCTITLTRSCNLRCKFCYAKKTQYVNNEMIDFINVTQIVDLCAEAKVKCIVLTGGEPTLYPELIDTIKYIKNKSHKLIATIATNATNMDDSNYCQQLINSGLNYVDVSLKGKNRQEYESVTGCDLFDKQMVAIGNLAKLSVDFTCSMVITPSNVYSFCEAIKKAYENGARKFSFTFVIDNEKSSENDLQYLERHNPFQIVGAFISKIDELNEITKGKWWIEYSFPMCVYSDCQLSVLKGRLAAPCQIFYRNGITFDGDMNLIPCSMNIETRLGKFGRDFSTYNDLKKITSSSPYKQAIDCLNSLPSEQCKNCKHLKKCLGGCTFFWNHFTFESFMIFKKLHSI